VTRESEQRRRGLIEARPRQFTRKCASKKTGNAQQARARQLVTIVEWIVGIEKQAFSVFIGEVNCRRASCFRGSFLCYFMSLDAGASE
jgi:hypothetical protein